MGGRDAIEMLVKINDSVSVMAMKIESDALTGVTITPEEMVEFAKAIRNNAQSTATMLRTMLSMIPA